MGARVTVRAVVLSRFALDGGAMHGIVPKALWARAHAADAENRIRLVARGFVVDAPAAGARTLVELGMGQRWSDKARGHYALEPGPDAPDALRAAGVDPDTVTHVVLTHLHWDHAGGIARADGSLAFPRAEHVVGRRALEHATGPAEKDAGSFRDEDLALLTRAARLRLWDAGELAPGLDARTSDGHTPGLVVPIARARDDGPPLAFPTDLVPTRSHLKPGWVMAYDNLPVESAREKHELFAELDRIGGGVALYHDPDVEAAYRVAGAFRLGTLAGPS
ncbi:MAG TPA: MBL fold metallo-hydrolase [Minicystis sp.]|nr:MBL fold metallo-hydrolase [Minicystis sp.]